MFIQPSFLPVVKSSSESKINWKDIIDRIRGEQPSMMLMFEFSGNFWLSLGIPFITQQITQ